MAVARALIRSRQRIIQYTQISKKIQKTTFKKNRLFTRTGLSQTSSTWNGGKSPDRYQKSNSVVVARYDGSDTGARKTVSIGLKSVIWARTKTRRMTPIKYGSRRTRVL